MNSEELLILLFYKREKRHFQVNQKKYNFLEFDWSINLSIYTNLFKCSSWKNYRSLTSFGNSFHNIK